MNEGMMMNGDMSGMMICAIITTVVVIAILVLLILQTVYQAKILREVRRIKEDHRQITRSGASDTADPS